MPEFLISEIAALHYVRYQLRLLIMEYTDFIVKLSSMIPLIPLSIPTHCLVLPYHATATKH